MYVLTQLVWVCILTSELAQLAANSQLFRLYLRSPLGKPMGPLEIPYPIGFLIPHWKSNPPQKSNGVSEFQWISRLMCSIGIPIPHRNSKHTMNNYFSPLEIQWVFHSFVMDGKRNEHSKTNIDLKSVKIHLGSLENRCPLKPLSCL